MAGLSALAIVDAQSLVGELAPVIAAGAEPDQLKQLHEVLIRSAGSAVEMPAALLSAATAAIGDLPAELLERLPIRPRVALRLLRAGVPQAAWAVLSDNAVGVVDAPIRTTTSSGAPRTAWRLPLLTAIEAPTVYADLPGFRDPRWSPPDACYDIGAGIRLKAHLDEATLGRALEFGGWAALDVVASSPEEHVRVVAVCGDCEVGWPAKRHRRADLVGGTGDALRRRVWAGWSASIELSDSGLTVGTWMLWIEVEHFDVVRRTRLGTSVGDLATRTVGARYADRRKSVVVGSKKAGWQLAVSAAKR
jgi:hypothetical protein